MAEPWTPWQPDLGLYVLDAAGKPVHEPDVLKWGEWLEKNNHRRQVARNRIGGILVSTVFLTVDHNYTRLMRDAAEEAHPILFETMVFNDYGSLDDDPLLFGRYETREEALAGHKRILATVRARTRWGAGAAH